MKTVLTMLCLCAAQSFAISNDSWNAATEATWRRQLAWAKIPAPTNFADAIGWFTNCMNVATCSVPTSGSSWFQIPMSCGRTTDNWHVETVACMLFHPYWREYTPRIIEMLDSDELYIRYAAYVLLQQKAGRRDNLYDFGMGREERKAGVDAWRAWWLRNVDNPRLDRPPKQVYEASDWDAGR